MSVTNTNEHELKSALYTGWVEHKRFTPTRHSFRYQVFMCYLDLSEIDRVLALSPLWSTSRFALARFRRQDYFDAGNDDLQSAIRNKIDSMLGIKLDGPIRMLTNLRYFGFIINPLTIYYCFDKSDKLQALLLEVTNTPWGERHHYAIASNPELPLHRTSFPKNLHVSPFHPMNIMYDWLSNTPGEQLDVFMNNRIMNNRTLESNRNEEIQETVFNAHLRLERVAISGSALNKVLLVYPFMTLKVLASIYWQALKLFIKGNPLYSHPTRISSIKNKGTDSGLS